MTSAAISLISDSLNILALLSWLFYKNWRLSDVLHRCGANYRLVDEDRQPQLSPLQRSGFRNSMGDITRVAKEAIEAHRLIKIFNAEDHQTRASSNASTKAQSRLERRQKMKLIRARAISNPVVQCIASVALGSVLYVAIRQVFTHPHAGRRSSSAF